MSKWCMSDRERRTTFSHNCEIILRTHTPQLAPHSNEAIEAQLGLSASLRSMGIRRFRMLGSWDPSSDAEDAAQETLARMPRIVQTWRRQGPFAGAVVTAFDRVCIDIRRRQRNGTKRIDDSELVVTRSTAVQNVVERERRELLWDALDSLPVMKRVVLVLKHGLDWPAKDISRLLDLSPGRVNSMSFQARPEIRDHLRGRDGYWDEFRRK